MAYAAVLSLKHTLEHLMQSSAEILLDPPSTKIIESAYEEVVYLHRELQKMDSRSRSRSVRASEEEMREEVCKIEDLIESHVSVQSLQGNPLDLQDLEQEISTFTVVLKRKRTDLPEIRIDDYDDVSTTLITDSGVNKSKTVGLYSDQFHYVKRTIMTPGGFWTRKFVLVGAAGIGKTFLAKQIFEDPDIVEHFESRAFVRVGRKNCEYIEIARRILAQLNPADSGILVIHGEKKIRRDLRKTLKSKNCFIVLDDVWDDHTRDKVDFLNELHGRCELLVTTRIEEVAGTRIHQEILNMQMMNKEESWNLFCAEVFGEELCPFELVRPGKKIVEKCEGLPLLIVTIANLLSKKEKSPEYWNKVVEDKRNRLLKDACKEIEEVLFPSYDHLTRYLRIFFLYMGVFPQDYEVPKSNIINLWTAEAFFEVNGAKIEAVALKCFNHLISNNVLLIYQSRKFYHHSNVTDVVKTCGLHISFWHLCNTEAEKDKFLHVLSNVEDGLKEGIKGHRRLCIHNNVLFGIKDVHSSIERVCASTARSLLCFGPYHQYAVPMCFGLRLVKVLDALAIRFYDFPMQVLKLVLLRYLALTCNRKLHPSISELRRLQFLIIGRHLSIKSSRGPSYVPMEIWDMKELQHLQIMGSDLQDPCGKVLPKLLKLKGVSAHSCTKEVLEGIPHLKKLGILIELEPNATQPLRCFDHISSLNELESLKCVVVNPTFVTPYVAPFSMIPSSLRKLSLSGLGYPWEYMTPIASLPYLEELKLRCHAFRGPKWEVQEYQFLNLCFLLVEDTDLVHLKVGREGFAFGANISMKHCYRLQELHLDSFIYFESFELVDCNPVAVNRVQQAIQDGSTISSGEDLVVRCSWKDGNLKSSELTNWSKRKFLKPM